jgi:hypothetical protein
MVTGVRPDAGAADVSTESGASGGSARGPRADVGIVGRLTPSIRHARIRFHAGYARPMANPAVAVLPGRDGALLAYDLVAALPRGTRTVVPGDHPKAVAAPELTAAIADFLAGPRRSTAN